MNKTVLNILTASLLVKLVLALYIPLTLDEYYYFLWGKYLSLSYFDHPPMVGWLMFFSQPLQAIAEGAIRWPFLLMSQATLLIWDQMIGQGLDDQRRLLFLWVMLLNPLWGWGVFVATPDIPLLFFWSLALYFCHRLLVRGRLVDYLGLGCSLGLGFLAKYQIALFLPALFLMLWQQQKWQKLFSPKTLAAIVVATLCCFPVFWWNYQNEWVSFDFQWKHGMSGKHWKPTYPIEYIVAQIFILFPTFLLFLFGKNRDWKKHWLLPFALFPYAFFLYSSFKGRVEANWPIMALPSFYAISLIYTEKIRLTFLKKTVALWCGLFVMALALIAFKSQFPTNKIKLFEADRFSALLSVEEKQKNLFAYSYQLASFLSFKKNRLICKLPGFGRPDHFQFIKDCPSFEQGFTYITESSDRRDFSKLSENLTIKSSHPINDQFKLVEVITK